MTFDVVRIPQSDLSTLLEQRGDTLSLSLTSVPGESQESDAPVATRIVQPIERVITEEELIAKAKAKADAMLLGTGNASGTLTAWLYVCVGAVAVFRPPERLASACMQSCPCVACHPRQTGPNQRLTQPRVSSSRRLKVRDLLLWRRKKRRHLPCMMINASQARCSLTCRPRRPTGANLGSCLVSRLHWTHSCVSTSKLCFCLVRVVHCCNPPQIR